MLVDDLLHSLPVSKCQQCRLRFTRCSRMVATTRAMSRQGAVVRGCGALQELPEGALKIARRIQEKYTRDCIATSLTQSKSAAGSLPVLYRRLPFVALGPDLASKLQLTQGCGTSCRRTPPWLCITASLQAVKKARHHLIVRLAPTRPT
jgi:hypothetical protein